MEDPSGSRIWGPECILKIFLKAFTEQADETIKNIQKLVDLERNYKEILREKNTSSNVVFLMEHMFSNPYITIPRAKEFLKVTYPSAKNVVMPLVDIGILKQTDIIYTVSSEVTGILYDYMKVL